MYANYDPVNDRFLLTNKTTGDVGITLEDVTGDFLAKSRLLTANSGAYPAAKTSSIRSTTPVRWRAKATQSTATVPESKAWR